METTEKIVDSYCRYIKKWFTIPNIKCSGQYEIDLLAVEFLPAGKIRRYHIESGVSISGSYSKLTDKEFSPEKLKVRVKQAEQRRTIGYFIKRKFGAKQVLDELEKYGFKGDNYSKVIVTWGWTDEAMKRADQKKVILWDFRGILHEIAAACKNEKIYFTDDTLRTIQLLEKSHDFVKNANSKTTNQ